MADEQVTVTVNAHDLRAVLDYFDFAQAKGRRPQRQANRLRAALDPPKPCDAWCVRTLMVDGVRQDTQINCVLVDGDHRVHKAGGKAGGVTDGWAWST